jgi:hypothetical protein
MTPAAAASADDASGLAPSFGARAQGHLQQLLRALLAAYEVNPAPQVAAPGIGIYAASRASSAVIACNIRIYSVQ